MKNNSVVKRLLILLYAAAVTSTVMGCSLNSKKEEMPEVTGTPPLEVPPGLVLPKKNHAMDIPPVEADFNN